MSSPATVSCSLLYRCDRQTIAIGPYLTVAAVWNIADIFNGLMAFPNLVALFALSGIVGKETRAYFARKNHDLKAMPKHK